jgi:hypothetical protein
VLTTDVTVGGQAIQDLLATAAKPDQVRGAEGSGAYAEIGTT